MNISGNILGKTNISLNQHQINGFLSPKEKPKYRASLRRLVKIPLRRNCNVGQIRNTNEECVDVIPVEY